MVMIETIKDIVWNIGGFIFTISIFLFMIAWSTSWVINRLSWWFNPQIRKDMFYWIQHKKRICDIIDKERGEKK